MSAKNISSLVSKDLLLFRTGNGIKLVKSCDAQQPQDPICYYTGYTVEKIMQLPFNFYFLNTEGVTLQMNDPCVEICGFQSVNDSIGKSLFDVSKQESAKELINNCNMVIAENRIKIFEEKHLRNDGATLCFLSVKSPWYDSQNNIIGTFGCSIVLGKHSLAESLIKIADLGLLNSSDFVFNNVVVPGIQHDSNYLSERESLCVYHLCKGFTLKETAKIIGLSPKTVETYVERAKQKLHCSNKAELIAAFLRQTAA